MNGNYLVEEPVYAANAEPIEEQENVYIVQRKEHPKRDNQITNLPINQQDIKSTKLASYIWEMEGKKKQNYLSNGMW